MKGEVIVANVTCTHGTSGISDETARYLAVVGPSRPSGTKRFEGIEKKQRAALLIIHAQRRFVIYFQSTALYLYQISFVAKGYLKLVTQENINSSRLFLQAGAEILNTETKENLPRITTLLATPYSMRGLMYGEPGAQGVVDWIKAQPLAAQRDILAAPGAVFSLADNGQARAVVDMIKSQPLSAQRDILAAQSSVSGLAHAGHAPTVIELIKTQPPAGQRDILAVPSSSILLVW